MIFSCVVCLKHYLAVVKKLLFFTDRNYDKCCNIFFRAGRG